MSNMNQLTVTVANKTLEAQGIASFELRRADGQPLPPFTAGAHIDVQLGPGLVRQYSLCNAPGERHRYQIAVLREPQSRGGSAAMHERIAVGDLLQISEPRNHFALVPAQCSLLLAGGIGITPILCMAEALSQAGADFEMHYCSRELERMAFKARIEGAAFAERVQFHFDAGPEAQKLAADRLLAQQPAGTHLYVCGPAGFIAHVLDQARRCGWPEDQLHREFFAAAPTEPQADAAFELRLARSGRTCQVPADKSALEVLLAHGIDVPMSCESGVCGTCLTRVLEGLPEHRDVYLTDAERARNDQFTPCCSRARSPLLVLDL